MISVPIERYPNVRFGQASILAFFPGASPEDVEALVTREIGVDGAWYQVNVEAQFLYHETR